MVSSLAGAARAQNDPAATLSATTASETAWQTSLFEPPPDALPPSHSVDGKLHIAAEPADRLEVLLDKFGFVSMVPQTRELPGANVTLVSSGFEVIPVERGPIVAGHPAWDWIFEPGRAWDLPSHPGTTFVALPFSLMEYDANCLHNGLALFAVGDSGETTQLAYQVGSETCPYFQFDMWGLTGAKFEPGPVAAKSQVLAAYEREVAARLPVRPISDLGAIATRFASPDDVKPEALTTFGFVHDGVLYAGACPTRHGPYPYCDVLDLPSFSWAKSIAGGIGLMRLEALYPGAKDALLVDYVPECANAGWEGVTFENLLDMATGHYNSAEPDIDEDAQPTTDFLIAKTHAAHVDLACRNYPRQEAPGIRTVYHTSDTYLLGTAMNAFLKAHRGADADSYRDLVVPLLEELGASPVMMETRRSIDAVRQPFTGWGLVLHRNDAALLAGFLQRGGTIDGKPMLDKTMLAEAMQQVPANAGLPIYNANWRYQHSLWVRNVGSQLGCAHDVWVPFLSGVGGLSNLILPSGDVYFRIGDGYDYNWLASALAANEIASLCN
ncbi:hypothetical protein GRI89_00925 [Altererythrobacter salegens]|uniref:Beta-lactamase-related domain-containing protein n=1 Tax=Croceibacterium salegens TaxID=1737568 RepID=A0A6I4SR83_9SPHN|nr:hypothetical protein [Croceibacterium salegens]MXO58109.1 hypothetical protein [Croceibacterium salegens]